MKALHDLYSVWLPVLHYDHAAPLHLQDSIVDFGPVYGFMPLNMLREWIYFWQESALNICPQLMRKNVSCSNTTDCRVWDRVVKTERWHAVVHFKKTLPADADGVLEFVQTVPYAMQAGWRQSLWTSMDWCWISGQSEMTQQAFFTSNPTRCYPPDLQLECYREGRRDL